jgi:orotate phosphoribosyltransferase
MLLELVTLSNGLVSVSSASSSTSRTLLCLFSRARSALADGSGRETASTLFCWLVDPALASSTANSAKLTSTMSVQTVEASRSNRLITRAASGAWLRYARAMTSSYANVVGPTDARDRLLAALREHALVIAEVTLTSGRKAQYYVDAKRAIMLTDAFNALGELVAEQARTCGASAVGGVPVSAIPVACAALAAGFPEKAFIVRKERKEHGLQRWIEGPELADGERCLLVEDVVTTGGSTIEAVERVQSEGLEIAGVVSVLDRLAGGGEAISAAIGGAPYVPLTTIDDVYPDRPDR